MATREIGINKVEYSFSHVEVQALKNVGSQCVNDLLKHCLKTGLFSRGRSRLVIDNGKLLVLDGVLRGFVEQRLERERPWQEGYPQMWRCE